MAGWRITLWVVLVLATLGFLYAVRGILLPFLLAIVISVVLDPSIRKLRARGLPRWAAVLLVLGGFFTALVAAGIWLAPVASSQLATFRTTVEKFSAGVSAPDPNQNYFVRWNPVAIVEAPQREDLLDRTLKDLTPTLKQLGLPTTRKALYDRYVAPNSKQIATGVQGFFNSFFGLIGAFTSQMFLLMLTPLLVFMILIDLEKLKKKSITWIPPSIRASTVELLNEIGDVFTSYLRGISLAVVIYMGVASLLLLLLGVPYPILLGMLLGLIYLVPYIRVFIWVPLLLVVCGFSGTTQWLFVSFPSPFIYAVMVVVVFLIFDTSFDTLITPRIIGKAVGINPVVSMFVSLAGAALFGIPGMLIAYPTAGAVKVILDRMLKFTSATADQLSLPAVPIRHRS